MCLTMAEFGAADIVSIHLSGDLAQGELVKAVYRLGLNVQASSAM